MSFLGRLIGGLLSYQALMERVKEDSSSEVLQKGRDQHIHIMILWKGLVASLYNHTSEVWYCAWSAHLRGWVQSSSELLRELWWKCSTSAECKTDISAVLTVKSGLDPHMINKLKDGFKSLFSYFLWSCWVPTICVVTLAYCCSEWEGVRSILKMMLSSRHAQPPVDSLWSWSHRFQDKLYNSDNPLIITFTWYCYWLFTYNVSICMKLDPGIHIVMYLVLSLKLGVTRV